MKKEFYVADAAGPMVAGLKSPGAGKKIMLTEGQAEHPLRLGHIVREAPKVEKPEPKKFEAKLKPTDKKD